jgi:hypothetical protein
MNLNTVIHCIGDSHVDFLSGYNCIQPEWPIPHDDRVPLYKTYRLGAVLAFTISKRDSKGYLRLREVLKTIPKGSYVMLVLGEIDCRVHLIKQSQIQKKNKETLVKECVDSYFESIIYLKKNKYKPVVWGVIPSTLFEVADSDYPTFGSCKERNEVTRLFNTYLEKRAKQENVPYISIYDKLVSANGLTKMDYFIDLIHLSTRAIPLVTVEVSQCLSVRDEQVESSKTVYWANYLHYYMTRRLLNFLLIRLRVYPVAQRFSRYLKK